MAVRLPYGFPLHAMPGSRLRHLHEALLNHMVVCLASEPSHYVKHA
jgi:hypothetical protein